jgi:hypothetical protein
MQPNSSNDDHQAHNGFHSLHALRPSIIKLLISTRTGAAIIIAPVIATHRSLVLILPPQRLQPLLLGVRVDVGSNHEADEVEERDPGLMREECLCEGEGDWRGDP